MSAPARASEYLTALHGMEGECWGKQGANRVWTRSTRGHRRAEPFNKAWASVGTRLSQQVAESVGPGQAGAGPGEPQRKRRKQRVGWSTVQWVAKRDTEATLSVRQTQGSHYGRVGAGTAARSARNPVSQQSPFRKSFISL